MKTVQLDYFKDKTTEALYMNQKLVGKGTEKKRCLGILGNDELVGIRICR